jgi:hypothetical protein
MKNKPGRNKYKIAKPKKAKSRLSTKPYEVANRFCSQRPPIYVLTEPRLAEAEAKAYPERYAYLLDLTVPSVFAIWF